MKKPHIKMSDCKFYVNEEKRTVVCVIEDTENAFINYVCYGDDSLQHVELYGKLLKVLEMPNSFCGKAVCAEEDNFDVELGKMMAFQRARHKFYSSFFKRAGLLVSTIDDELERFSAAVNRIGAKVSDNFEGMNQKIDEMLGE